MTGLPNALESPKFPTELLSTLRRLSRRLKPDTAGAPMEALVHCRLCGAPHGPRSNHLCPRLYGR